MKRLSVLLCVGVAVFLSGAGPALSQTSSTLYPFISGSAGDQPSSLIQAQDGNFYGITSYGGGQGICQDDQGNATGCGTIFRLSPSGAETPLYSFSGETDGGIPSSLVQGPDGNLYGTTMIGGPDNQNLNLCTATDGSGTAAPCCLDQNSDALTCGTVFEFDPSKTPFALNTLYTFSGNTDGASPGTLIAGTTSSGTAVIYGTTLACSNCGSGFPGYNLFGTVFRFVPSGSTPVTPNPIVTFPDTLPASSSFTLAYPNSLIQADQYTLYGTSQMGGDPSPTDPCPANTTGSFGCGGVFRVDLSGPSLLEVCDFGDNSCPVAASPQGAPLPDSRTASRNIRPNVVMRQSGSRFPVGGNTWGYFTVPIGLSMDSSGNIYGTTPAGCAVASTYSLNPNCSSSPSEQSSIFELIPVAKASASSANKLNILYSFSGNAGVDGAESIAGLTLATDGNFYGLSGDGATASEVFQLPLQSGSLPSYVSLGPSYSPNWMIQGSDGNFYGTSSTYIPGGQDQFGSVFKVAPSSPLSPPVQLCWQSSCSGSQINAGSQIQLGSSATLTWTVPNAFSLTSQQCYAFVEGTNASTAGSWSGLQKGALANSAYSGSTSIKPAATGTYTYALTCGGTVSSSTSLQVTPAQLTFPTIALPAAALNQSYSASVGNQASGGVAPYAFTVASGALPAGLSLDQNDGAITGSATARGAFTFSITATDSETPAQSVTTSFSITVMGPSLSVALSVQPNAGLTYGQTVAIIATESPVEGVAQGYSWTIDDGSTVLVTGAASNGTNGGYTMTTSPLAVGQHTFTATYLSTQSFYPPGSSSPVTVTVSKATPTVTAWPAASAIGFGQSLTSSILSGGTASVPGTFAWTTPTTVPGIGSYSGSVTFTPADNTDYNSVTGTVTVTVNTGPGFTLSTSPTSVSVAQGGSGTTTVTVADVGGFSGAVTLAAIGLPSGITPLFAAGTAAGTQLLSLTASTSARVTSAPVAVTITGTSATLSLPVTTSISLSITAQPAFAPGSGGTTSISVAPGATTGDTGTISVVGTNGFTGVVNLTCQVNTTMTGVNDMPTCGMTPASVTISGAPAETSTLTVNTTAATNAKNNLKNLFGPTGGATLALILFAGVPRRRRAWLRLSGILLLCASFGVLGCGGGGGGSSGGEGQGSPGTTAGNYTITVTGSSGSVAATVGTIKLTVQ